MRLLNLKYVVAFCINITKKIELRIGYFHWPWAKRNPCFKWYDFSIKETFTWLIYFTIMDREKAKMIQFRIMFLSIAFLIKKEIKKCQKI